MNDIDTERLPDAALWIQGAANAQRIEVHHKGIASTVFTALAVMDIAGVKGEYLEHTVKATAGLADAIVRYGHDDVAIGIGASWDAAKVFAMSFRRSMHSAHECDESCHSAPVEG